MILYALDLDDLRLVLVATQKEMKEQIGVDSNGKPDAATWEEYRSTSPVVTKLEKAIDDVEQLIGACGHVVNVRRPE